ncbi:ClbS/DfsB family four-helix bundle protein [Kallotenue papyrolyticum]|uniref:ClbS/DfsB family four-helix bundle protein n=1 Tax=Kallotenue papyrolyticum TaxID=1325125 RepID=UPI000492DB89|nr:ClbS/DfsB family four-helix bundle protein [Kallotenue papyrolyticum]
MAQQRITTKAELLAAIEQAWLALHATLDQLTDAELTTIKDAHGWTIKDHIIHMTAWERSVVCFLQGTPRHVGLGVSESVYIRGNEDDINALIYQQQKDRPISEALEQLRAVHDQLMTLIQPLTDGDLQKRYRDYLPDEPGEGDGPPAINVIYGNTAHHFTEHRRWIERLIGRRIVNYTVVCSADEGINQRRSA